MKEKYELGTYGLFLPNGKQFMKNGKHQTVTLRKQGIVWNGEVIE